MLRAQAPRDQVQRLSNINLVLLVTLLVALLFHSKVLPKRLPPMGTGQPESGFLDLRSFNAIYGKKRIRTIPPSLSNHLIHAKPCTSLRIPTDR